MKVFLNWTFSSQDAFRMKMSPSFQPSALQQLPTSIQLQHQQLQRRQLQLLLQNLQQQQLLLRPLQQPLPVQLQQHHMKVLQI